jgi:glycosyltransferase involved in cell wall biosynthesis
VVAGGRPDQVAAARSDAARAGLGDGVIFAGQRPADEIPSFLDAADLLVSPRSSGTNTPLKIYQYLRSGRAIVATRLLTHTQVLDDSVAILTEPTAEGFARGIIAGIEDPAMAQAVGERARRLADTKYSYEAYLSRTRQAVAHIAGPSAARVAGETA